MASARTRLTSSAGNEHNPGNPFGRTELAIAPDGAAHLELHRVGEQKTWTGQVAPAAVERVWAALERAGFPAVPEHPVPPGATFRVLAAGEGPGRRVASIEWHAAAKVDGYDEAFAVLDAVVRALSEDAVPLGPAPEPGLVTNVRSVDVGPSAAPVANGQRPSGAPEQIEAMAATAAHDSAGRAPSLWRRLWRALGGS